MCTSDLTCAVIVNTSEFGVQKRAYFFVSVLQIADNAGVVEEPKVESKHV